MNTVVLNSISKMVPNKVTVGAARKLLVLKKNSPTIFFGLGIAGSITGTVMACRATLKLPDKLDEIKKDVDTLKDLKTDLESGKNEMPRSGTYYDENLYYKDMLQVYTKAALSLGKLYGPSIVVSVASISLLTKSHNQLKQRNNVLMAAYATLQEAYDEYRQRVRDQLGEERELDFFHGTRTEVITDENGKKEEVKVVDPNHLGPFSVIFDDLSPYWEKDAEYNRMFLHGRQEHMNLILRTRGHVLLNDVLDQIGLPRTKEGAIFGWLKDGGPDASGDGHIDFGVYAAYNAKFVKGWERSVILTFNPDGVIFDKI